MRSQSKAISVWVAAWVLLPGAAAIAAAPPAAWKAAQQAVKIEAPVSAATRAATATAGTVPAAAATTVVETPPAPPPTLRRLVLTRDLDLQSIAAVRQKIAQSVAPGEPPPVILPGAVSLPVGGGGTVEIRHVILPGERLVYDASSDQFVGSIRVGAVAYGGEAPSTLSDPVTFQVLDAGTNVASTIVVKTLAPPFDAIAVKVRNPRPPVTLRVASGTDQPSSDVVVPLEPTLFVQPVRRSIPGDGLGKTELQIQAITDSLLPGQAVLLSAEPAAELSPSRVVLGADGTGVATLTSVGTGHVKITARATGFEEASTTVDFNGVARALSVSPRNSTIQGYGLGTTVLTIVATAPDLPADMPVTLNVDPAGNLESKEYRLMQGRLDLPMQSEGVGEVKVTVSAPNFTPGTTTVTFEPPVETVVAGLGGGLLGGTGRALARPNRRRKWLTVFTNLALSVIVALVAFLAFKIGWNVLPFTPTSTTGAVFIAAFAALVAFGCSVFVERLLQGAGDTTR